MIVNSLTSVSLEPPLIAFCPARSSLTWSRMRRTRFFGVNVLGAQHERFASRATPAGADRFTGLAWQLGPSGVPLLADALATIECEMAAEHPAGDHWIVVGRVLDLRTPATGDPLVFYGGAFRGPASRSL
jgi:flavin reductase (DIM6/NTAB) family NADH-FMN oxidoreductase RutF